MKVWQAIMFVASAISGAAGVAWNLGVESGHAAGKRLQNITCTKMMSMTGDGACRVSCYEVRYKRGIECSTRIVEGDCEGPWAMDYTEGTKNGLPIRQWSTPEWSDSCSD